MSQGGLAPWWRRVAYKPLPDAFFEPDLLMPVQFRASRGGENLPNEARLFRAVLDNVMRDLQKYPLKSKLRADALAWVADPCGKHHDYTVTFCMAVDGGYVGLDAELLSHELVRRYIDKPFLRDDFNAFRSDVYRKSSYRKVVAT